MPTQLAHAVAPQAQDVTPVSSLDPSEMPCKSAFPAAASNSPSNTNSNQASLKRDNNHDGVVPTKVPHYESQSSSQAAALDVTAGLMTAQEEAFAGSKAKTDMDYAIQWLKSNPETHARVLAVLKKYDAKFYQRASSSNVPFWREVLSDLVGKAGHKTATATLSPATASAASHPDDHLLPASATLNDTTTTTTPIPANPSSTSSDEEPCDDDSFFVIDLARVIVQYAKFKRNFPRLQPHYAVKCNDSIPIVAMISALGGSFDCASKGEFNMILDGGYQTAEHIIYAHPCKMANNIVAANRRGVYLTTFDNEDELEKLHRLMPKAQAVLRIATDDRAAVCEFSTKFGCPFVETTRLLERAKELGVSIVGVSFHVGSGNSSFAAYDRAIRDARSIFDTATAMGFEMTLVDIGGGFPGSDPEPDPVTGQRTLFEDTAGFIRPLLDELFPEGSGVRLIAEPGRYFAESPYAICMQIHSKRKMMKRDGTEEHQFYTSDGKYQAFNCMIYDHANPNVQVLKPDPEAKTRNTTIFGPTCDGIDWIMKQQPFPALDIGDWIFVPDFGAYTVAAGSKFNGFVTRRIEYISSLDVFDA